MSDDDDDADLMQEEEAAEIEEEFEQLNKRRKKSDDPPSEFEEEDEEEDEEGEEDEQSSSANDGEEVEFEAAANLHATYDSDRDRTSARGADEEEEDDDDDTATELGIDDASEDLKESLGLNIHPIPPDGAHGAAESSWSPIIQDHQSMWRPARHMVLNVHSSFLQENPQMLFALESHEDKATNVRATSLAAIMGLLGIMSRGYFVRGIGSIDELEVLEKFDDVKHQEAALDAIKYVQSYMFRHYFRSTEDDECTQHPLHNAPIGAKLRYYIASSFSFFVETLYSQLLVTREGIDDRGEEIGIRIHLCVWNKKFSLADFLQRCISETNLLHRHSRVSRLPMEHASKLKADMAKQCTVMVASSNLRESAKGKFLQVESQKTLYQCFLAVQGEGCGGGAVRPFRPPESKLGSGSITRPMVPDRTLGCTHALSFEVMLNARASDGCAMLAGLVDKDGVTATLHPKQQVYAQNYANSDMMLRFPYADGRTVFMLTDNEKSLLDTTLPNKISSLFKVGDTILDAYWIYNKGTDSVDAMENEVISTTVGLTREALELRHVKTRLAHNFSRDLDAGDSQTPLIARRLHSCKLIEQDSYYSLQTQERLALNTAFEADETIHNTVTLQAEVVAAKINRVLVIIDEAKKTKLKACQNDVSEKEKVHLWFSKATTECMVWAIETFDNIYNDPQFSSKVEPVTKSIWRSTMKLLRKIPEYARDTIVIDRTSPFRRRGTANVAFAFNKYMMYKKLSPFANWRRELCKLYGSVMGIQGRRNDIKLTLHDCAIAPANPHTIREIFVLHGKRAMGKSLYLKCFEFLFNREFDPETSCKWFNFKGGGSKCANISGGIDFCSGGVAWSDEAIEYIANSDPASKKQMQETKQLTSDKKTSQPRCENIKKDGTGRSEYCTVNHEYYSNTSLIYAHNLGANCQYNRDELPTVPDDDRKAFLDRTFSIAVSESSVAETIDKGEFEKRINEHKELVTTHSVVVRITYIVKHVISLVSRWKPSNEAAANDAWSLIDDWLKKEYDIPKPDDRRRTVRRDIALTAAIESAVVQVLVYKETAVSFDDMLPISKPFSDSTPESKRIHTLAPFSFSQLATIIKFVHYDVEVCVDAASKTLDRGMYTCPDMHHIMVAFSQRHGIGHALTGQTISTSSSKRAMGQGDMEVNTSSSSDDADDAASGSGASAAAASSSSFPGQFDPNPNAADQFAPFGSAFDPGPTSAPPPQERSAVDTAMMMDDDEEEDDDVGGGPKKRSREAAASSNKQGKQVAPPPSSSTSRTIAVTSNGDALIDYTLKDARRWTSEESKIRSTIGVQKERRIATQSLMNRALETGGGATKAERDDPKGTIDKTIRRLMIGSSKSKSDSCVLINGKTMKFSKFMDLVTPTPGEILDGGYAPEDLFRWLNGNISQTNFTPQDGELVYFGVSPTKCHSLVSSGSNYVALWSFKLNQSEPKNSERRLDASWRTPKSSFDTMARDASSSADGTDGAAAAGTSSSKVKRGGVRGWIVCLHREAEAMAKFRLSKFNLESSQIFDRLQRVIASDEKNKRTLQVSSTDTQNCWMNSHTLMRVMKDSYNDKYTGADAEKCVTMSDSVTPDNRQQIIPIHAFGWRGSLSSSEHKKHHEHRERDKSTQHIDVSIDDIAQRRLDMMILDKSLPAIYPFISTTVSEGSPIQVDNGGELYLNSAYGLGIIRLDMEMSDLLATIPGTRDIYGEVTSVPTTTTTTTTQYSPDGTEEGPESSPRSTDGVVTLEQESELDVQSGSCVNMRVPPSVETIVDVMIAEKRDDPTESDIQTCMAQAKYTRRRGLELFDKSSIFWTLNMTELFSHDDDVFYDTVVRSYPAVFSNANKLKSIIPHLCTRFSEAIDNVEQTKFQWGNSNLALLTVPRVQLNNSTSASTSNASASTSTPRKPNKKNATTHTTIGMEELELVQRQHFETTGEWIADIKRLKKMACKRMAATSSSNIAMKTRRAFISDLITSKYDAGFLEVRNGRSLLYRSFQELGTGVVAHMRKMSATQKIPATGDPFVDERAKYLWPVPDSVMRMDGTCEEVEQSRIKNCIKYRLYMKKTGSSSNDDGEDDDDDECDGESEDGFEPMFYADD